MKLCRKIPDNPYLLIERGLDADDDNMNSKYHIPVYQSETIPDQTEVNFKQINIKL